MKGAIIAGLSARTWEHHTDKFYSNLISEEANLSVCSQLLLSFINAPSSILDEKSEYERLSGTGYLLVLSVLVGWKDFFNDFSYEPLMDSFSKRDQYLITVIGDIISRLRHGASKAQAIEGVQDIVNGVDSLSSNDFGGYIFHAWQCFKKSWDYTSALHNGYV